MKLKIHNQTNNDFEKHQNMFHDFFKFAQNQLGFDKEVELYLISDPQNEADPLGRTAYYDPDNYVVVVYTDGRHIKDLLRSFSHELVHHNQNCEGQFENSGETFEGYAQEDPHLRKMEKEAYLYGNMNFRDWEDGYKKSNDMLREWLKKKVDKLLLQESRNKKYGKK